MIINLIQIPVVEFGIKFHGSDDKCQIRGSGRSRKIELGENCKRGGFPNIFHKRGGSAHRNCKELRSTDRLWLLRWRVIKTLFKCFIEKRTSGRTRRGLPPNCTDLPFDRQTRFCDMLLLSREGSEHRRLMSLGAAPSGPLFCQYRRLLAVTGCDPQ